MSKIAAIQFAVGEQVRSVAFKSRAAFDGVVVSKFINGKGGTRYNVRDEAGMEWQRHATELSRTK